MAGNDDAQRVAAHRRADVPRLRPAPQAARELAVGSRFPAGHARHQLPDPPTELAELARRLLEPSSLRAPNAD
jgi:hypothetical protein